MGEVRIDIVVVNPRTGAQSEAITAFADTAATLTVIPAEILRRLGIQKVRTEAFRSYQSHRSLSEGNFCLAAGKAVMSVD